MEKMFIIDENTLKSSVIDLPFDYKKLNWNKSTIIFNGKAVATVPNKLAVDITNMLNFSYNEGSSAIIRNMEYIDLEDKLTELLNLRNFKKSLIKV